MVSQWVNTIKSPWMHTAMSLDHTCCLDAKLQLPTPNPLPADAITKSNMNQLSVFCAKRTYRVEYSHQQLARPLGVGLLVFYIPTTSKVISGRAPTCERVHLWWRYSAAPLGNQTTSTMTQYPTQFHYLNTELTSHHPVLLLMPNAKLGSNKYKLLKSLIWLDRNPNSRSPAREVRALPVSPPHSLMAVASFICLFVAVLLPSNI